MIRRHQRAAPARRGSCGGRPDLRVYAVV